MGPGFLLRPTGDSEGRESTRREERFLDSSQRVRDHSVTYHLSPAIADFILDMNRGCCNYELLQTLTLLHSEWSKEIEPSRQSSTHHPLIVSNPIDKKDSEFMRRSMRWEAPSMPTAEYDPGILCEQETPLEIERIGSWTKRFQQVVSSESKTRRRYGKSERTKRESSRRKV